MAPVIQLPFNIALHSYALTILLAVVFCHSIGPRWGHALEQLEPGAIRHSLVWLGFAAFAGGRVHLVANHPSAFVATPVEVLKVWKGLHAGGAIVALVAAAPFVVRRYSIPLGKFADGIVPTIGLGIAVARLGCFVQGCCFGTLCSLPWCVSFPSGSESYTLQVESGLLSSGATRALPVHPLQLYFATAGLLITLVTLWLQRRKRYHGQPALIALFLFSVSSAALEFLRADLGTRVYWGPLPQLEWIAISMTTVSAVALAGTELLHRRFKGPTSTGGRESSLCRATG